MSADAAISETLTRRPALPRYSDYLRSVIALGRRAIRPALPAIGFLYFYRLGMGIFLEFSSRSAWPPGETDRMVFAVLLTLGGLLPLLALIYTPFLPLQDALLRGREIGFLQAIKRVLEVAWNFMVSSLAQSLIAFLPLAIVFVAALAMQGSNAPIPGAKLAATFLVLTAPIGALWAMVATLFLCFATPAVVLNGEGPFHSLKTSAALVRGHVGGILGRFLAFAFLAVIAYMAASLPSAFILAMEGASQVSPIPFRIAGVVWSSAVDSLLFPFWVAALLVLYRALAPTPVAAPDAPPESAAPEGGLRASANPLLFE